MARSRTSSALELLVPLDRDAARAAPPAARRGRSARRSATGGWRPGAPLPSSRALAAQLGVSRGIVVEAYEQLVAEGYLVAPAGRRDARRADAAPRGGAARRRPASRRRTASTSGPAARTSTEFPRAAWLRSLRRALADAPSDRLSYLGGRGVPGAAASRSRRTSTGSGAPPRTRRTS